MEVENNHLIDYIKIYDDVFEKKVLKTFLKICSEAKEFNEGMIVNSDGSKIKNKKVRDTLTWSPLNLIGTYTDAHWCCFLQFTFNKYLTQYKEDLNLNLSTKLTDIQILKYGNNGHYQFHVDHGAFISRTLSLIFLLNDEYEGGDLVFQNPTNKKEYKIDKKSNRIIIWPSTFLYPHGVSPVIKGTRYSVVSWAL
tara:strand:+ start:2515 stop:3099 length:585 start_codon:yes stop_codon:yes gene_type:complete